MGLILPNYLLTRKDFVCDKCSFKFYKHGPSRVEKCPQCSNVIFEKNYKRGETLDSYSQAKLRWYSDTSGERHRDEIKHRAIKQVGGEKVVANLDSKGKVIDYLPSFDPKGSKVGTKEGKGEL